MANLPILPRPEVRIAEPGKLYPAGTWYDFFRLLRQFVSDNAGNAENIVAVLLRLEALEAAESAFTITGNASVQVAGSPADGAVVLFLEGDDPIPGPVKLYAADDDGAKGWHPLYPDWIPNPYADYLIDGDGNYLVDGDGNFLTGQDGFPIPLAYGGTGGDYADVLDNLFFASPDGTNGSPVFRAIVADDIPDHNDVNGLQGGGAAERYHLTAAQQADVATLSTGGTTGQFWRGDQSYTNELLGPAVFTIDGAGVGFTVTKYSADTAGFQYRGQKARGSLASPSQVTSGDALFTFQGRGWFTGGTPGFSGNVGDCSLNATEAFSNTAQGTRWSWSTTVIGTTTRADRLYLDDAALKPAINNAVTCADSAARWALTYTRDMVVGSATASLGGGVGVAFFSNATTNPSSNPSGGGILYADAGAGKWRGSSGTTTTFGPANPHCPVCGSDFVHEWDNPQKYGYLAVCMNCHADGTNSHTRIRGAWDTHKG